MFSRDREDALALNDTDNAAWFVKGYELGLDRAIELIGKYGSEDARMCVLILREADILLNK